MNPKNEPADSQQPATLPDSDPTSSQGRRSLFKNPIAILLLMVIAVAGIIYGAQVLQQAFAQESTDDAFVDAHIISIAPKVSGRIGRVFIQDNQRVKKGDLLFEIEPDDLASVVAQRKAALESANAQQNSAEASLKQAFAHVATIESGYAASSAIMDAAEAAAKRQNGDLQRNKQLASTGVISSQEFEHSTEDAVVANANLLSKAKELEATGAFLKEAQTQVDVATAQTSAAKAAVSKARAELEQAELQLSYTRIIAPEDGRITNKSIEPGIYVQTGQPLFALVPEEIWITANFKETQITHMIPGQSAAIRMDAYPDKLFKAHVDSIQAGSGSRFSLMPPENATGNYVKVVQRVPVKIIFDETIDPKYALGPGMSAIPSVNIQTSPVTRIVILVLEGMALLLVFVGMILLLRRKP